MADPGVFGTVYDVASGYARNPAQAIRDLENKLIFNTDYKFDYDVFPEDLGSEQMNHYMLMKFYTQGQTVREQAPYGSLSAAAGTRGFSRNNYNVALFMPSESGGGIFPNFSDTHEYPDISMSNLMLDQLGVAGKMFKGSAAMFGRAINPGVQVLYKTTHLRTFEFAFLFAPRSENESRSMENIIKTIRKYSAPEDTGIFYKSPAEVVIEFHHGGNINPHIIKMKRQVVTYIDVNYAPQGVYSTFTNGHPVSCMFAMKTREMEIIDKNDVEAGF